MSMTPKIRRELIWWCTTKHTKKYEPMVVSPDFDPNLEATSRNFPFEFYGAKYCSDAIKQAHSEYGELSYAPDGKGCNCHGV